MSLYHKRINNNDPILPKQPATKYIKIKRDSGEFLHGLVKGTMQKGNFNKKEYLFDQLDEIRQELKKELEK